MPIRCKDVPYICIMPYLLMSNNIIILCVLHTCIRSSYLRVLLYIYRYAFILNYSIEEGMYKVHTFVSIYILYNIGTHIYIGACEYIINRCCINVIGVRSDGRAHNNTAGSRCKEYVLHGRRTGRKKKFDLQRIYYNQLTDRSITSPDGCK